MPTPLPPRASLGLAAAAAAVLVLVPADLRAQRHGALTVAARLTPATAPPVRSAAWSLPASGQRSAGSREEFVRFVGVGAAVGMLAGGGYGLYDAATCNDCFPGLQPAVFLGDLIVGAAVGAVAGAAVYVVSWPVRAALRR